MAASAGLVALVSQGVSELATNLINAYAKRVAGVTIERITQLKSNITPHIDATFAKCSVVKTLLNPHRPANFLAIYARQTFSLSDRKFDHYEMVEYIRKDANNVILTGTGGSGKSIFTKYLWLSLFVESDGKIPLFLELRNINNITTDNILTYLQQTISIGQALLTEKDFRDHLVRGDFIIIFDGFDEVIQDKKESVQKQIISVAENYRNLKIIVTSRPDGRFGSWPSFEVAQVAPLEKQDVIELIELAEFSDDSKKSFLKRLRDTNLFDKHNSFLSNPLLASMMLLTFSHNFDIPDRMHLFYQQAFDALYQRHDSYKPGGFTREFKTTLSEDVFKRILAYFCLITYNDEDFTFTRESALAPLRQAIKLVGEDVDPAKMLEDLNMCVCFLILDGLQYVFSHRSFQEYFAAYCMAFLVPERIDRLVPKFAKRDNDQVITLLADMSPENFRRRYLVPTTEAFKPELQLNVPSRSIEKFYEGASFSFNFEMIELPDRDTTTGATRKKAIEQIHLSGDNDFYYFVGLIDRLRRRSDPEVKRPSDAVERDRVVVVSILKSLGVMKTNSVSVIARDGKFNYVIKEKRGGFGKLSGKQKLLAAEKINETAVKPIIRDDFDLIFKQSYMFEFILRIFDGVTGFLSNQIALESTSVDTMDDLFGV